MMCDDDQDPANAVREWWNSDRRHDPTPRVHLFEQLGLTRPATLGTNGEPVRVGRGWVSWWRQNPAHLAQRPTGDGELCQRVQALARTAGIPWSETNRFLLRRGPYLVAAGLDESVSTNPTELRGRWVNLFDPDLRVQRVVRVAPGDRQFWVDLDQVRGSRPRVLASAGKALPEAKPRSRRESTWTVEGVANTPAILLLHAPREPLAVELEGRALPAEAVEYSAAERLLWVRFTNESRPRALTLRF